MVYIPIRGKYARYHTRKHMFMNLIYLWDVSFEVCSYPLWRRI